MINEKFSVFFISLRYSGGVFEVARSSVPIIKFKLRVSRWFKILHNNISSYIIYHIYIKFFFFTLTWSISWLGSYYEIKVLFCSPRFWCFMWGFLKVSSNINKPYANNHWYNDIMKYVKRRNILFIEHYPPFLKYKKQQLQTYL